MYEILDDYHLSDTNKIDERIKSLDEKTLRDLYEETKRYYKRNMESIISKFQPRESLNVYPSGLVQYPETKFVDFSKRLCLYADKIVLHDPFYDILRSMDVGLRVEFIKDQLKHVLQYYLDLKELVDSEIVYCVPYDRIILPANEEISKTARTDCANPDFREICVENIEIGLDRAETDELSYSFIFTRLGLVPPSKFSVGLHFKGAKGPVGFEMSPGRPFKISAGGKSIEMKPLRVPKSTMETDEQIKNQIEHLLFWQAKEIISSLYLGKLFNACSITNSEVMWKLLNWKFGNIEAESKTISSLLEIDLKFLDNINIKDILKVRKEEESVFKDFRQSFGEYCQEIRSMPETEDFKKEILNLKKEKIDPQLRKLDRQFKRIKKYRYIRGAAIGIGTLSGAAILGGAAIPVLSGGLATLLREYGEYDKERDNLKENPLYFLWKLKSS